MRHISIENLCQVAFGNADGKKLIERLTVAHKTVETMLENERQAYIDRNGSSKWSPVKNLMTTQLGNKCWYTEVELVGADLTIDHYRPKCEYWWLGRNSGAQRIEYAPDRYRSGTEHSVARGAGTGSRNAGGFNQGGPNVAGGGVHVNGSHIKSEHIR